MGAVKNILKCFSVISSTCAKDTLPRLSGPQSEGSARTGTGKRKVRMPALTAPMALPLLEIRPFLDNASFFLFKS
jgi:hypothetical protein